MPFGMRQFGRPGMGVRPPAPAPAPPGVADMGMMEQAPALSGWGSMKQMGDPMAPAPPLPVAPPDLGAIGGNVGRAMGQGGFTGRPGMSPGMGLGGAMREMSAPPPSMAMVGRPGRARGPIRMPGGGGPRMRARGPQQY